MTLTLFDMTLIVVVMFFLAGLPLLAIFWSVRAHQKTIIKRDLFLKTQFGQNIKIYRSFPIPQGIEEIVQGGLRETIQQFRELIVAGPWLFIQPTHRKIGTVTVTEDRNTASLSLFAITLSSVSPSFLIRNSRNKSVISHYYQVQIDNKQFVPSELNFDDEQSLFTEPGKHLQALQIMSPEVLVTLKEAPGNADVIIRKNQLYYILPGEQPAEDIVAQLIKHSTHVARELEDNLNRWASSESNKPEVEAIKNLDLAVTLREA